MIARSKATAPDMPGPPPTLTEAALELWNTLAPRLYEDGRLTPVDVPALAGICRAYARYLAAEAEIDSGGAVVKSHAGFAVANPFLAVSKGCWKQYLDGCAAFGLTPRARGESARRTTANAIKASNPVSPRSTRRTASA